MERESILDMIRRLLALGQSPNENESASAIAKAEKMMAEYNVSLAEVEGTDETNWQERVVWTGGGGRSNPVDAAGCICSELFFVRVFYRSWRGGSELVFFGQPHNVDIAEYVLNYLAEVFHDQWLIARRRRGFDRKHARGFYFGMAEGLAQKIRARRRRAQAKESAGSPNALAVIDNELTQRFDAKDIPAAKPSEPDWSAGRDGYDAGQAIEIAPAICGGGALQELPESTSGAQEGRES